MFEQFAARIASIRDLEPRFTYIAHTLSRMTPPTVAGVFAMALGQQALRRSPHPQLLLAMTVAVILNPSLRGDVVEAAAQRGLLNLVRLLSGGRFGASGQRPSNNEALRRKPREVAADGSRVLTLGERKSLARTGNREVIAKAIQDNHPAVIALLLQNPFLTEPDVVRVCTKRPINPSVIEAVLRQPRWLVRYRVLRALVLNATTPIELSLPLSPHLTGPDARLVASSPSLPSALRHACGLADADTQTMTEPTLH